jgi:hypothetical protein
VICMAGMPIGGAYMVFFFDKPRWGGENPPPD